MGTVVERRSFEDSRACVAYRKCLSTHPGSSIFGSPHSPHLAALPAAAEESIATIGLESRDAGSRRHLELLQHLACSRIDAPQFALVVFPGAVPQLAIDPGHAGDETVR